MNIVLSKQNHLKIGYDEIPYSFRHNLYNKFYVQYGKISTLNLTFRQACILAASEIADICDRLGIRPLVINKNDIYTELIIASFLASKKDFSIANLKLKYDSTDIEMDHPLLLGKNLDIHYFDIDLSESFNDPLILNKVKKADAQGIGDQSLMLITGKIRDRFFPVTDNLKIFLNRVNVNTTESSEWVWCNYENRCSYYFHCLKENLNACPSFTHWSPEIIHSFLNDYTVRQIIENRIMGKISIRTTLSKLFQNSFPEHRFSSSLFDPPSIKMPGSWKDRINQNSRYSDLYDYHSCIKFEYSELINLLRNQNV